VELQILRHAANEFNKNNNYNNNTENTKTTLAVNCRYTSTQKLEGEIK
jgi:hypothetical protein